MVLADESEGAFGERRVGGELACLHAHAQELEGGRQTLDEVPQNGGLLVPALGPRWTERLLLGLSERAASISFLSAGRQDSRIARAWICRGSEW